MPPPHTLTPLSPLAVIVNMNNHLEDRVGALEDKVAALQSIIEAQMASRAAPSTKPAPSIPLRQQPPPIAKQAKPSSTAASVGINWMGLLAALFFVLAAVYLVNLSIESGWLTPARQLVLAAFAGGVLMAIPETGWIRDRAYASILSASGVAILQLTSFAGHFIHGLYGVSFAFMLCSGASLIAIYLYLRHQFGAYVVISVLGVYAGLLALGVRNADLMETGLFLLMWNLVYITLSMKTGVRWILQISAFCAFIAVALSGFGSVEKIMVVTVQGTQFLLFLLATAWTSRHHGDMTTTESWAFFPLLLLYYFHLHHLLESIHPFAAAGFGVGLALLVFALRSAIGRKQLTSAASGPMILTFAAVTLAHAIFMNLFGDTERLWGGVLLAMCAPFLARRIPRAQDWIGVWAVFVLLIFWSQLNALIDLGGQLPSWQQSSALLIYAFLILGYLFSMKKGTASASETETKFALGAWAHLLMLRAIWLACGALLSENVGTIATLISALYAMAVLMWSWRGRDEAMARGAVGVLALISVKFALWDMNDTEGFVRILALLGLGAILYVCGLLFRKTQAWKTPPASYPQSPNLDTSSH